MYECICGRICVYVHMGVRIHVCMCVSVCAWMHVCICVAKEKEEKIFRVGGSHRQKHSKRDERASCRPSGLLHLMPLGLLPHSPSSPGDMLGAFVFPILQWCNVTWP